MAHLASVPDAACCQMRMTPMRLDRRTFCVSALASVASDARADTRPPDTIVERQDGPMIVLRDDLGDQITLRAPVRRVAVFNRYNAEFLRAIAGTDVIVGAGADTLRDPTYWPDLHAALIGQGQTSSNYEAIVALRPDVVIFPRNAGWTKAREALAPFGIPVVVLTAWDVLKHERNVELLGRLLGQPARAAELNGFYRAIREKLARQTAGRPRPRVYFEEVGAYKTVLKGSGWHDMIEAAGGENIFGTLTETSAAAARGNNQSFDVDPEEILSRRPDVIIKLEPNQYAPHPPSFSQTILRSVADRPGFAATPAVVNSHVYNISYYLAGACSKIVGALQIATWLHPDRFKEEEAADAMRVWLEHFQGVPYPGGYWQSLGATSP